MTTPFEEFVAASPRPQRDGLKALVFLASRSRGRRLLARVPLALQAADSVSAMVRYDDPDQAKKLGWDAAAVAARGRELRRVEGRP